MQDAAALSQPLFPIAPQPLTVPDAARERLRILYVAKHACAAGRPDAEDGTHAVYHAEMRAVLQGIGFDLTVANDYTALFARPEVDFVVPLLNRGGFLNSEMLLPLLCNRLGLPYLGAGPIVRGVADDKHLTKLIARSRGIPTADWAVYRRGNPVDPARCPKAERHVVKPNASSASWGVRAAVGWAEIAAAVAAIHAEGHDAIVEPFITGHDIEVPIITIDGRPVILPVMIVEQRDPAGLRHYAEKRDLAGGDRTYTMRPYDDEGRLRAITAAARTLMEEFAPFDYGRFECRLDAATGQFRFMEVNLNCNLWSRKTISLAARLAGWTHAQLIETILCESLRRHGLIDVAEDSPSRALPRPPVQERVPAAASL